MKDRYGRTITYMRISLTDRCNMRCIYCQPDGFQQLEHKDILRYEEILRICRLAVQLGITRFKVTGGEPLVRKGCVDFLRLLKKLPGVEQVTLTTNGSLLAHRDAQGKTVATALAELGLDGVNISLDCVDQVGFREITRSDLYEKMLAGLQAAKIAGLKVKLNCVPLKQIGVQGILQLLALAESYAVPVRFIELMPLTCNTGLESYTAGDVKRILEQSGHALQRLQVSLGNGPSVYYRAENISVLVGFIEPIHGKFCASCNRVRLTSTGKLKLCLYSDVGIDLRELLRGGADDKTIYTALERAVQQKPREHGFTEQMANFSMNEIGG